MCDATVGPMLLDDILRLLVSFFLFFCCIVLYYIFTKKKPWDVGFWICFSGFLFALGSYGYVVHHIYLENTFSYDGFISGAAFITVCGLLFSRRRYVDFSNKITDGNYMILFSTYIVFAFVYIFTINYNFSCIVDIHQYFIDALQVVVYPLLLLFAATAFLFRFAICISVFSVCMFLFIVENVVFIFHAINFQGNNSVLFEEMLCAIASIIISTIAIYVLRVAKKAYKERVDD